MAVWLRAVRVGRIAVDQARGSRRLPARTGRQASSPMSMADASIEAMEDVRDTAPARILSSYSDLQEFQS